MTYWGTPINNILLISPEGDVIKRIDKVHIQCDKPFTKTLDLESLINKVGSVPVLVCLVINWHFFQTKFGCRASTSKVFTSNFMLKLLLYMK